MNTNARKLHPHEQPFITEWPEPAQRFMRAELAPAPTLPLTEVLGPNLAKWIVNAADAKGAPADFVLAAVLSVSSALIGNTRWVSPRDGWAEPPIVWSACIGPPSSGKSPAMDAALSPLRRAERKLRERAEAERRSWADSAEVAKLADAAWKETAKVAIKDGKTPPPRPVEAVCRPEPHIPRLVVNDITVERLGVIISRQPRGTLQMRDELEGWLRNMIRYSNGSSDRPFWLEAYGGRSFTVERVGREPLTVDHLSIGVMGGIQPDRLRNLLLRADDDGLLARFQPIWPDAAPLKWPGDWENEKLFDLAIDQLLTLDLVADKDGKRGPMWLAFAEPARGRMYEFQMTVREWEAKADGLLMSYIGKLPGLAARLSLILAHLDWTTEEGEEPREIGVEHFERAVHFVQNYLLPMARRAYGAASVPKTDRAARHLVSVIREYGWHSFSTRMVLRLERSGLMTAAELDPAIAALEEGDVIRAEEAEPRPQGGRPQRRYSVNPALHRR